MDLSPLLPFLPAPEALPTIQGWLRDEDFELIISRPRSTKLGDFRPPRPGKRAKITLNSNLRPYQFLTTLIHEIAHLKTWNAFGRSAAPHGKEWKAIFGFMLKEMAAAHHWPQSYNQALLHHAERPKSAVGGDPLLQKTVLELDGQSDILLLEEIADGQAFVFKGRKFRRIEKRRTRALVTEISTGRQYTIPLIAQVAL